MIKTIYGRLDAPEILEREAQKEQEELGELQLNFNDLTEDLSIDEIMEIFYQAEIETKLKKYDLLQNWYLMISYALIYLRTKKIEKRRGELKI